MAGKAAFEFSSHLWKGEKEINIARIPFLMPWKHCSVVAAKAPVSCYSWKWYIGSPADSQSLAGVWNCVNSQHSPESPLLPFQGFANQHALANAPHLLCK